MIDCRGSGTRSISARAAFVAFVNNTSVIDVSLLAPGVGIYSPVLFSANNAIFK